MKRKRFSEEQNHRHPARARRRRFNRRPVPQGRHVEASLYAWKAKYGGMNVSDAQKLKGLEAESAS